MSKTLNIYIERERERELYINLMIITNQNSIIETHKKEKEIQT